jgi:membrane protein DedA with SNARE-associated domain
VLFELFLGYFYALDPGSMRACVFLVFFSCGLGMPLSQDLFLLAAATTTLMGVLKPVPLVLLAWAGLLAGDTVTFWTGRYFGARWIRLPWAQRYVPPPALARVEAGTRRWGPLLAFAARLLPGQRGTLFFVYGTLRMPWWQFLAFDALAAAVHVPLLVYGARALHWRWEAWQGPLDHVDDVLTLGLVVLVIWWVRRQKPVNPPTSATTSR